MVTNKESLRRTPLSVTGPERLAQHLDGCAVRFTVVGSLARGVDLPRDLDILIDRSEDAVRAIEAALEDVALGDWRPSLRRWAAGVFGSPVTILTVHGPLDVWETNRGSG